jgi:hypothetical protein
MFTWGLSRTNFSFAMAISSFLVVSGGPGVELFGCPESLTIEDEAVILEEARSGL